MRFAAPACSLLFFAAAFAARPDTGAEPQPADTATRRGVAYFEAPKSIGTPLDELARNYTGFGLADRIAGIVHPGGTWAAATLADYRSVTRRRPETACCSRNVFVRYLQRRP